MRILLAEDDAQLSTRLTDDLRRRGYAVDVAADGIAAEHQGSEIAYDAVILDLGLPGQSGLDVLRHWRAGGNAVPVLILTARDAWHQKVDGFNAGADDYLGKPFHVEELCARLGALLRRRHAQHGGVVATAGLTLDEDNQAVTCDGQAIALSGVEFRLLRCFMLHPGRVMSKTELAQHIYDDDSDRDSNVIEVYVSHLRNKIGQQRIRTRRGQGYVLEAQP
jgi:two-component system, OmpR family, response regulator